MISNGGRAADAFPSSRSKAANAKMAILSADMAEIIV